MPSAAAPARSNVLAVASGKGGVGKTWFSITLAHALARAGRKVLLFDGDLGLANVDVQLGLTPGDDLGAVIAGRIPLERARVRYADGGFDLIAGRSGSGSLATLTADRLASLRRSVDGVGRDYDRVVLDLGAGIERPVRLMARNSRACLVIATEEPTSITDAYAFLKVARLEGLCADLRIVINMAPSLRAGEQTYAALRRACREFLKFEPPLAGIIHRDDHVRDSIRRQTALLNRHPGAEAAADVERIAAYVIDEM
ncbi:MAG: MinD/ParA family protein [Alphaproteobacteria bacterium]|nr:MinD/ParA family protein [Alphaproteobacteria bacterium]